MALSFALFGDSIPTAVSGLSVDGAGTFLSRLKPDHHDITRSHPHHGEYDVNFKLKTKSE